MADKKPVYNPPTNDDASSATTKSSSNSTRASALASEKTKLSVGAIVGISAAGLALLVGASVAGSAIALAATHGDRPHSQQGAEGMPGDGNRDGMKGQGKDQGGQMGEMGEMGEMGSGDGDRDHDRDRDRNGGMPHQHDANGNDLLPNGESPDGQLPPAPNATPQAK